MCIRDSYGNEAVMLEKLITETEKEMQAVRDAEQRKDLQELNALTHHLRSSWGRVISISFFGRFGVVIIEIS